MRSVTSTSTAIHLGVLEDHHLHGLDVVLALERLGHRGGLRTIPFDEEDLHAGTLARLVMDVGLDHIVEAMLDPRDGLLAVLAVRDDDDCLDGAFRRLLLPGVGHQETERGSHEFRRTRESLGFLEFPHRADHRVGHRDADDRHGESHVNSDLSGVGAEIIIFHESLLCACDISGRCSAGRTSFATPSWLPRWSPWSWPGPTLSSR